MRPRGTRALEAVAGVGAARAEVVRCVTQAGFEVEAGGSYKHEKLDISDWTAGGASEDDGEDEDGEDDADDGSESGDAS